MPRWLKADITCYCGREHAAAPVGERVRCRCGVTLRLQQKKHETGVVYGRIKLGKYAAWRARYIIGQPCRLRSKITAWK